MKIVKIKRAIAYFLSPALLKKRIHDDIRKAHEYADLLKTLERRALSEFSACNPAINAQKINYDDIPRIRLTRQNIGKTVSDPPRIVFVLLQYNHFEVTRDAIESISRLDNGIIHEIVIVDNFSTDGARSRLQEFADKKENIHVVLADKNHGFAKGNNLGYDFAKRKLNPDFIVIANNDVVYPQHDFTKKIPEIYRSTLFSILGPDIRVQREKLMHQNPMKTKLLTKEAASLFLQKRTSMLQNIDSASLSLPSVLGRRKFKKRTMTGPIVLHGSIVILSPIFIHDMDFVFDDRTFFYGEEDLLATLAYSKGHRMVYDPRIHVLHNEKSSTDTSNLLEYYKKSYSYHIDFIKIYIEFLTQLEQLDKNTQKGITS